MTDPNSVLMIWEKYVVIVSWSDITKKEKKRRNKIKHQHEI